MKNERNIKVGVISNTSASYLPEAMNFETDISWYEYLNREVGDFRINNFRLSDEIVENLIKILVDELAVDFESTNECQLINFKKTEEKKDSWYWFENLKYGFKPDTSAEYCAICKEIYTQIVFSRWLISCRYCSPCYPDQGDINSEGDEVLAFCLPPDMFGESEEEKKIVKRIFLR